MPDVGVGAVGALVMVLVTDAGLESESDIIACKHG